MKKLVLALLMLFTINAFAEGSPCTVEKLPGVYKGSIDGGGEWGETVFYYDQNNSLYGIYFMHFPDRTSTGMFNNLTLVNGTVTGDWTDEFGTGQVNFQFADECAGFNGGWGWVGSMVIDRPWVGTRTVN